MSFRALSIIQPWPWLILRPDLTATAAREAARASGWMKDIENRIWATSERGWVLVHASGSRLAKWDYAAAAMFAAKRGVEIPMRESLPTFAVVGAMRIDACVTESPSRWFQPDPENRELARGFAIGAAVPFAEPVTCTGTLKFFPLPSLHPKPGEDIASLQAALEREIRLAGLAEAFALPAAA